MLWWTVALAGCADRDGSCDAWAAQGQCAHNAEYMTVQCPRACGVCVTPRALAREVERAGWSFVDRNVSCARVRWGRGTIGEAFGWCTVARKCDAIFAVVDARRSLLDRRSRTIGLGRDCRPTSVAVDARLAILRRSDGPSRLATHLLRIARQSGRLDDFRLAYDAGAGHRECAVGMATIAHESGDDPTVLRLLRPYADEVLYSRSKERYALSQAARALEDRGAWEDALAIYERMVEATPELRARACSCCVLARRTDCVPRCVDGWSNGPIAWADLADAYDLAGDGAAAETTRRQAAFAAATR